MLENLRYERSLYVIGLRNAMLDGNEEEVYQFEQEVKHIDEQIRQIEEVA